MSTPSASSWLAVSDARVLFLARIIRLLAYGAISVVLVLYLAALGLKEKQIGILLTLTLIGDAGISLWITVTADRVGRRRMLLLGSGLMALAGLLFVLTDDFTLLLFAATVGVISPSGYEVGPFLAIEQAALSQIVPGNRRTHAFAWYNLIGSFATATGALAGGLTVEGIQWATGSTLWGYKAVIIGYGVLGLVLALLFHRLSPVVESASVGGAASTADNLRHRFGLHRSKGIVIRLSALFSVDAFAGGFIIQTFLAYWFYLRFKVEPGALGAIFFGANVVAGISSLTAAWVASRIGLIRTMVFTHIPSNILLILVPLMPTLPLAIAVLLLRFSISQMDIPTRQSYTMAVVHPDERSAAAGITGIARTIGASLSPTLAGPLLAGAATMNLPFYLAGALKILYDLLLYRSFITLKPPEEKP